MGLTTEYEVRIWRLQTGYKYKPEVRQDEQRASRNNERAAVVYFPQSGGFSGDHFTMIASSARDNSSGVPPCSVMR